MKLLKILAGALAAAMLVPCYVMAATVDYTVGGSTAFPSTTKGKVYLQERYMDCLPPSSGSSPVSGSATFVNGNTYQVLTIPAGTYVSEVGYEIVQGDDSAVTITIGDGSDADGYITSASVRTGATARASTGWTIGSSSIEVVKDVALSTTTGPHMTTLTPTTKPGMITVTPATSLGLTDVAQAVGPGMVSLSASTAQAMTDATLVLAPAVTTVTYTTTNYSFVIDTAGVTSAVSVTVVTGVSTSGANFAQSMTTNGTAFVTGVSTTGQNFVTGITTSGLAFVTGVSTTGQNFVESIATNGANGILTASISTNGATVYPITTAPSAYANGKFYATADTIDVVIGGANATRLRLKVRALMCPIASSTSQ